MQLFIGRRKELFVLSIGFGKGSVWVDLGVFYIQLDYK